MLSIKKNVNFDLKESSNRLKKKMQTMDQKMQVIDQKHASHQRKIFESSAKNTSHLYESHLPKRSKNLSHRCKKDASNRPKSEMQAMVQKKCNSSKNTTF